MDLCKLRASTKSRQWGCVILVLSCWPLEGIWQQWLWCFLPPPVGLEQRT